MRGSLPCCSTPKGPHFSFGAASRSTCRSTALSMLAGLHALIVRMVESPVTILVAVHGQCLGGGLELALAGHLMFVAPDAEPRPAGNAARRIRSGRVLPAARTHRTAARVRFARIGPRALPGPKRLRWGLRRRQRQSPERAALAYFDEYLKPKSAQSLRHAVRAARLDYVARVKTKLAAVERLYLDELMATRDAVEGLEAFLSKRPAQWEHC